MRRRVAACAVACVVATFTRAASATPTSRLTYLRSTGAERCPDEGELRKAIAARLGYDPFFSWARRTVVAEIGRAKGRFLATVKILDESGVVRGERTLASTSDDCVEVMTALALAISIAVDDFELDMPAPPAPPSADAVVPAALPPARAAPPPEATPPPERIAPAATPPSTTFHVWLTPVATVGASPALALGAQAGFETRFRGIASLGLEARGDLPASKTVLRGARVRSNLVLVSLAACLRAPAPLFICGLGALGSFHESGGGLAEAQSDDALFAALGARVGIALPLTGAFFFLAHGDALTPLTRHVVQIDRENVFEVAPVMGSAGIGAGATF